MYIGPGGKQISFSSTDEIDTRHNSSIDQNVYAVLIDNQLQNGSTYHTVTIALYFKVRDGQQNQSVYCRTSNGDMTASIIRLLGNFDDFWKCTAA